MNILIKIPIYNQDVIISVGETDSSFIQYVSEYINPFNDLSDHIFHFDSARDGRARMVITPDAGSYIRVKTEIDSPFAQGALAHEIFHYCYGILEEIGVENEGAVAYLIQYVTTKFYEASESNGKIKNDQQRT